MACNCTPNKHLLLVFFLYTCSKIGYLSWIHVTLPFIHITSSHKSSVSNSQYHGHVDQPRATQSQTIMVVMVYTVTPQLTARVSWSRGCVSKRGWHSKWLALPAVAPTLLCQPFEWCVWTPATVLSHCISSNLQVCIMHCNQPRSMAAYTIYHYTDFNQNI